MLDCDERETVAVRPFPFDWQEAQVEVSPSLCVQYLVLLIGKFPVAGAAEAGQ